MRALVRARAWAERREKTSWGSRVCPGLTVCLSVSSRFTTSCAPCRATTTARASAVRTSSLISQGLRVCQTKSGIIYISLTATIAFDAWDSPPFSLWSAHSAPATTSYSVVSDGHALKVPASRVERAGGGDGCEDIRWDKCARPSAVRVTGGARSFSVYHFFPIVYLAEMEGAGWKIK